MTKLDEESICVAHHFLKIFFTLSFAAHFSMSKEISGSLSFYEAQRLKIKTKKHCY